MAPATELNPLMVSSTTVAVFLATLSCTLAVKKSITWGGLGQQLTTFNRAITWSRMVSGLSETWPLDWFVDGEGVVFIWFNYD